MSLSAIGGGGAVGGGGAGGGWVAMAAGCDALPHPVTKIATAKVIASNSIRFMDNLLTTGFLRVDSR
jgi:hypothetical protein